MDVLKYFLHFHAKTAEHSLKKFLDKIYGEEL